MTIDLPTAPDIIYMLVVLDYDILLQDVYNSQPMCFVLNHALIDGPNLLLAQ